MSSAGIRRPGLILGSSSPRRRDLLDKVGLRYEVMKPDVPEVLGRGETPVGYVTRLAREKAAWVASQVESQGRYRDDGAIVISADTIVLLGEAVLEKPSDAADAARMLRRLSGATHVVHTGVCLWALPAQSRPQKPRTVGFTVATAVTLKQLSEHEIAAYIRTGEPLDKAGGYAAQGIGSYMVKRIDGSYANVVGLPVAELVERLEQDFQYPLWA